MLEILLELILDIFWTRKPDFDPELSLLETPQFHLLFCFPPYCALCLSWLFGFFRNKIAIHHTVCYCLAKGLSERAFWQEEECYDVGSGRDNLLLEKQSQMDNNYFNMKYDLKYEIWISEWVIDKESYLCWIFSVGPQPWTLKKKCSNYIRGRSTHNVIPILWIKLEYNLILNSPNLNSWNCEWCKSSNELVFLPVVSLGFFL